MLKRWFSCVARTGQGLGGENVVGRKSLEACFRKPVIPVLWDPVSQANLIAQASIAFLQGGSVGDLERVLDSFSSSVLREIPLFVHIDLVAGLENSEAGVEYLANLNRISGVVTVHHHLTGAIRKAGLLSIVRLFLSDSRALDRGLSIVNKSQPDAVEILPAVIAAKVASDFAACRIPRIAGGLCRNEKDVAEVISSGCRAVTSTSPTLWKLNSA